MIPDEWTDHLINGQGSNTRPEQQSHFSKCFTHQQCALPHSFYLFLRFINDHTCKYPLKTKPGKLANAGLDYF